MAVDCTELEATIEADTLLEQQLQEQLSEVQLRLTDNWMLWWEHCSATATAESVERQAGVEAKETVIVVLVCIGSAAFGALFGWIAGAMSERDDIRETVREVLRELDEEQGRENSHNHSLDGGNSNGRRRTD